MSADSAHGESGLVLFATLAANLGIAVARSAAVGITGSAAMLTEGFHSVVGSLSQILLLQGQKRAARPTGAVERMIAGIEVDLRARWPEIGSLYIKPKAMVNASS